MTSLDVNDLQNWILVEAYESGSASGRPAPDTPEPDPRLIGEYFVSRRSIYMKYFGLTEDPWRRPSEGTPRSEAPCLTRLKTAAILARSLKRLLERKMVEMPSLGGLECGVRQVLTIFADYIFLTERGAERARALRARSRPA